jgi:hypothetical protein
MAPNDHEPRYSTQAYAGDQARLAHRMVGVNLPAGEQPTRADLQAGIAVGQSARLVADVPVGDDRAIGCLPNWEAMTSTELYAAATNGNSPATADSLGRGFNDGGNQLAEAANQLLVAIRELDSAWRGSAADSAGAALLTLAEGAGQAGMTAQLMGARMAQQAAAAAEVAKLPPPREFDLCGELLTALANPNPVAGMVDMQVRRSEADAVRREQIAYLDAYTNAMSAVDAQMPTFLAPTSAIGSGGSGQPDVTGRMADYPGPSGAGGPQLTSIGAPAPSATAALPAAGGDHAFGEGTDGRQIDLLPGSGLGTGTSGYVQGAGPASAGLPPAGPSAAGGTHPSTPSAGAGGFGGGFGSFGSTGGPARGSAAGAGGPARPGGGAEDDPAGGPGRRAAAPVARPGAGIAGAGGRTDGEEDHEHQRPSYLIEADPDSAFGTDQATAPPVIGGDQP